ncbi:rhodanese-like domain-containing protein [Biformimicrobium ophioploci]|uniref:Rhodanese-like domain-containing protein n=1 Tax=Biformimicrobium ophioploci TaxID=3036711 RepID=A0ABQ6M153_9GAMM|nr:rhodanese-like domain-containing protein [Microbulbifer sp. NKW57]GMG87995.1 rhodanese-like domain-containing protein [Microbulbifer sp. NKW57]
MDAQIEYYQKKLNYEIDSWDLYDSLGEGVNIIVIDARSPEAFQQQHIPGALNIPHRTMNADTMAHLDKSLDYVTYCDGIGCNASTKAALNMARLGFRVRELLGGLDWWQRDGYATEGLKATSGKEVVCGC